MVVLKGADPPAVTFLHQFLEPGVYYFHSIMSREIHLEIHVHACQYCTGRRGRGFRGGSRGS